MTLKLAAQEQMLHGETLIEKWRFAQSVGFDGIELRGEGEGKFAHRLPEIRAAVDAGAVLPTVCVMMDHFIGDFDAERRRDAVDNMKILLSVIAEAQGLGAITPAAYGMFSRALPPFNPPRSADQDREVLLAGLRELGEHAGANGVTVLLEPLNRYEDHMVNTLEQGVALCREVGLPSVRVIGDFFHMNIEETDPIESLLRAAPYLGHMQLGDSSRLEPGTGHIDFAASIAALDEAGYDGWYAMECGLSGDPADVLPAVSRYLRGGRA
ncbi:MAG: sugar phosphate isomerase/epimerase [Actinomycetota bacterium]|nr:sugar phosphate isomerase/epimerase [Actinomycetota bacterium]